MRLSSFVRVGLVGLGVALCAASVKPQPQAGAAKTEKNVVFYETRPKFEWPHRKGSTYRVVVYKITTDPLNPRNIVYDEINYTERNWVPPDDLDFETRYELYVYNDANAVVTSWGFTVGYEPAKVLYPEPQAKVRNLSPEIRIAPLKYPYVFYSFEIAEDNAFDKVADKGFIAHRDNVREFAGQDNELGTNDDVRFVRWGSTRVLKPNQTYHWRVRAYYYTKEELAAGVAPDPANALGSSEVVGQFTIPPQSGSDSLANVTQVTRDSTNTYMPTLNKRLELAYVMELPNGGKEIRTAGATVRAGVPVFDTGREEFTKSVNGSVDLRPQWDVDGEGIFFDSDRTQKIANIWYKRRDSRGYTQLTFHDKDAWYPSISKDGNKIAYQVRNPQVGAGWSIWMVDRDGRSATELGAGENPQFSPDGTKIAFSQKDANGNAQIWVMDANGGNRIQLTNEFNNELPTWHPGGKKLVFVSDRSGNADVWLVETDGARMVQLTNYLGYDITPEFTPDGRYLMFASTRGGEVFHLWMGELSDH